MIFNKCGRRIKEKFKVDGNELEVVMTYTYLGVEMSVSGSFTTAIKVLAEKARKAMMPLYRTIMQFQIPFKNALRLFHTFIEPILLYNSENLSTLSDKQLAKCKNNHNLLYSISLNSPSTITQLKMLKFILGLKNSALTWQCWEK